MKRMFAWLALLALVPLAGCVVEEGEQESMGDGGGDDADVVVEEGSELECSGWTEDQGDEQVGSVDCEVQDEA